MEFAGGEIHLMNIIIFFKSFKLTDSVRNQYYVILNDQFTFKTVLIKSTQPILLELIRIFNLELLVTN